MFFSDFSQGFHTTRAKHPTKSVVHKTHFPAVLFFFLDQIQPQCPAVNTCTKNINMKINFNNLIKHNTRNY